MSLDVDGPFASAVGPEADNLVIRAARALDPDRGAQILLTKNLPVAAGLGGGSSDAAAALIGLDRLWRLGRTREELATLGAGLGSDVPVCVLRRTAYVGGTGTEVTPAAFPPPAPLVLVNPAVPLATQAVYRMREGAFSLPARLAEMPANAAALATRLAERRNDLEPAARRLVPEVATVLAELARLPGCRLARMCGSGATCFGMFESDAAAARGAAVLRALRPGWWVASTRLTPAPA